MYSGAYFAQESISGEGCTHSTIPRHLISLCTKSAPLSTKIKRSKIILVQNMRAYYTNRANRLTPLKRRLPTLAMINHSIVSTSGLNSSVKQRTGAAGESRGGLRTLPNRHSPKPRIDCAAILGKLSSLCLLHKEIYVTHPLNPHDICLLPCGSAKSASTLCSRSAASVPVRGTYCCLW